MTNYYSNGYMGQPLYYSPLHPNYFTNAMQQNYGIPTQQQSQQPQSQTQQTITTQPPILQSNNSSKIILVSNKDEATAAPVDLVYGTPTFFHNKGQNEIYLKQFDVPTGTAIFKTYIEKPMEEVIENQINNYDKQFTYIKEGIDSLYRILMQIQKEKTKDFEDEENEIEEKKVKVKNK